MYKRQEKIYKIARENILRAISPPMSKFTKGEIDEDTFWETRSKNSKLPIHEDCSKVFHKPLDIYGLPYKSIIKFTGKLQKLGYKNIVLSDEFKPQSANIEKLWRYDNFDSTLLSCDIWLSKYDDVTDSTNKVFDYALNKYWLQPQEAIFIDDKKENCISAQRVWIKSIVAESPNQVIRDLKELLKI